MTNKQVLPKFREIKAIILNITSNHLHRRLCPTYSKLQMQLKILNTKTWAPSMVLLWPPPVGRTRQECIICRRKGDPFRAQVLICNNSSIHMLLSRQVSNLELRCPVSLFAASSNQCNNLMGNRCSWLSSSNNKCLRWCNTNRVLLRLEVCLHTRTTSSAGSPCTIRIIWSTPTSSNKCGTMTCAEKLSVS